MTDASPMCDGNHRCPRRPLVALALLLAACSADSSSDGRAATITLDTIPVTEVSATGPDGTVLLGNASLATRLSNGNVVIADDNRGDITLRAFDSTGKHLRHFGRKGRGPGEFEDISALARCAGDSLFVFDYTLQRVVIFTPSGQLARTTPVRPLATVICSANGAALGVSPILDLFLPTVQNAGRLQHLAVDLMTASDTLRLYDSLPASDPRFGGRMPAFAVAGNRAIVGLTDSAFAAVFRVDGTKLPPVRVSNDPEPQTQAGFVRTLDAFFARYPGLADQKAQFLKLPHPDLAPAYFALYGSPDGTLWTELSAPDDSTVHLRTTDSLGTVIGDINLPFPLTIFEIGNDYILGRRENEIGEQRVVVYEMGRKGGTGRAGR